MKRLLSQHIAEQPVIRPNKYPVACSNSDGAACAAHTWINYTDKDGPFREIAIAGGEYPGSRTHVLRGNIVRNIHNLSLRRNPQHHALHYPHIAIAKPKICHKS